MNKRNEERELLRESLKNIKELNHIGSNIHLIKEDMLGKGKQWVTELKNEICDVIEKGNYENIKESMEALRENYS